MRRHRICREEVVRSLSRVQEQFEHEGESYRFDGRPILRLIVGAKSIIEKHAAQAVPLLFGLRSLIGLRPSSITASAAILGADYWNYQDPWGLCDWIANATQIDILRHLIP